MLSALRSAQSGFRRTPGGGVVYLPGIWAWPVLDAQDSTHPQKKKKQSSRVRFSICVIRGRKRHKKMASLFEFFIVGNVFYTLFETMVLLNGVNVWDNIEIWKYFR